MWLLLALSMIGVGLWAHRLLGVRELTSASLLPCLWLGLSLSIALLLWWSLFARVGGGAPLVVLAAIGLSGLFLHRRALQSMWRKKNISLASAALFTLFVIFIADRSIGPCNCYDTGLYHAQAVKWSAAYATVPGLANVHHRLAFNNSSLV